MAHEYIIKCCGEEHQLSIDEAGSICLHDHDLDEEQVSVELGDRPSECFRIFLELTGDPYRALWVSADRRNVVYAEMALLAMGEDVVVTNLERAFRVAVSKGSLEIVEMLVDRGVDVQHKDNFGMIAAAEHGYFEIVKYLVEHGADVRAGDSAAVRWAQIEGHHEIVEYLISHGASSEATDSFDKYFEW